MKSYLKTESFVFDHDGNTKKIIKELPELKYGDALLKLLVCGVCSGEAMPWYVSKKQDKILGHELIAEVIKVKGKSKLKKGDIVFPHHHAPCGKCILCKNNLDTNCQTWKSSMLIPGGYSNEFIVPSNNIKKDTLIIPKKLPAEAFVFIEPLACCFRGIDKIKMNKNDKVLIIGLGIMGILNAFISSKITKQPLIGTDFIKERLDKSHHFGVKHSFNPDKNLNENIKKIWKGSLADVVIVNPSSKEAIEQSSMLLNPGGRLLIFAPPPPSSNPQINFNELYFKEIIITSSYSCGPNDTKKALNFVVKNHNKLITLISHRMNIKDLGKAINLIKNMDTNVFKIIVKP